MGTRFLLMGSTAGGTQAPERECEQVRGRCVQHTQMETLDTQSWSPGASGQQT